MLPPEPDGGRSARGDWRAILQEDRRLLVGALVFAAAAALLYEIVRHVAW